MTASQTKTDYAPYGAAIMGDGNVEGITARLLEDFAVHEIQAALC